MPRKILIVDDHAVFREGISCLLNGEKDVIVCAQAEDGPSALRLAQAAKVDLALVDIGMEGMNGLELTRHLRKRFPSLRILILSMHDERLYAERALRAGANGYVSKRESSRVLLSAIRRVLKGETYVSEVVNERILQGLRNASDSAPRSSVERLSDRELEVFRLLAKGYGTRSIADRLNISTKTVETHREHIREKINVPSTSELLRYAIAWASTENA